MQKGQALIFILLGIIMIAFVGVAFYAGKITPKPPVQNPAVTSTPQPTSSPSLIDETANWKIYTNKTYGYSFKYPQDWNLDISKAEPATANNAPASPDTSIVTLSQNGYTFNFTYNLSGVGGFAAISAYTEEIIIDEKKFLKVFTNVKTDPPCLPASTGGIDPQTGKEIQPKQECYDHFNQIRINNSSNQKEIADIFVNINGRTSTIGLELPKLMKLDDKEFLQYNDIFNKILSSIKLPVK